MLPDRLRQRSLCWPTSSPPPRSLPVHRVPASRRHGAARGVAFDESDGKGWGHAGAAVGATTRTSSGLAVDAGGVLGHLRVGGGSRSGDVVAVALPVDRVRRYSERVGRTGVVVLAGEDAGCGAVGAGVGRDVDAIGAGVVLGGLHSGLFWVCHRAQLRLAVGVARGDRLRLRHHERVSGARGPGDRPG
eukprot:ctg_1813.g494